MVASQRLIIAECRFHADTATIRHRNTVGNELPVTAQIRPGSLEPEEVSVELYFGPLEPGGGLTHAIQLRGFPRL